MTAKQNRSNTVKKLPSFYPYHSQVKYKQTCNSSIEKNLILKGLSELLQTLTFSKQHTSVFPGVKTVVLKIKI